MIDKNEISLGFKIEDLIDEYQEKLLKLESLLEDFFEAESNVKSGCIVRGTFFRPAFNTSASLHLSTMKESLLKSAWQAAANACKFELIAPVSDRQSFERSIQDPPDFTYENILNTFGDYVKDPVNNILRGMAEIFINLDPAYKSHSKVKVGVKGLPKRIILPNMASAKYGGYGKDRVKDIVSALQVFDGAGITDPQIIWDICNQKIDKYRGNEFRWFKNGNLHIIFNEYTCLQINRALAAYYGDVLPDVEESPDKKRPSTALSKDLQYYPTPNKVADRMLENIFIKDGFKILEPSCGCGRLIEAIYRDVGEKGISITVHGIEVNPFRVKEARDKGFNIQQANFLELSGNASYDIIIMNPPFYGKHYVKHIEHAKKFLKEGGLIYSILPATAYYDHKLIDFIKWYDFPVGSFSESGTNVPTGYGLIKA